MSSAPHFAIDREEFWRDPYPAFAAMRREAPICCVPQLGSTLFTRRDDIFVCEKRIDVFSSHQPAGLMNRLMGHNMMRKDGDAHMAERAIYFPAVSPKAMRAHWREAFQAHADRILDALAPQGCADLLSDFALPLSGECLKSVTGLTNIRYQDMDAWSQGMMDGIANYAGDPALEARCHAATAGIDAAINDMLPVVRKTPNHSMLSVMIQGGMPEENVRHKHQADDFGRPERAAQGDRRVHLGAADASRAACAGARRQGDVAIRVRGIRALDLADRHVAAAHSQGLRGERRGASAGGPSVPD